MYQARYGEGWVHETAARFAGFCRERNLHPMSAAVAWVGSHPAVTAPIIGARSVEQLRASLDSVKIDMTPALRAEIAAFSRTPPAGYRPSWRKPVGEERTAGAIDRIAGGQRHVSALAKSRGRCPDRFLGIRAHDAERAAKRASCGAFPPAG